MELVNKIEKQMEGIFKDLPALPKGFKDGLVSILPWLALIFGILQLAAAWGLWRLVSVTNVWVDYANDLSRAYGGSGVGYSSTDKVVIYGGIIILLIDAIILLLAFQPLGKNLKRGWDLLFLSSLINLVYAFVQIFISGRGVGSFIFSLIGSAIGFYFLYQIRDHYKKK